MSFSIENLGLDIVSDFVLRYSKLRVWVLEINKIWLRN